MRTTHEDCRENRLRPGPECQSRGLTIAICNPSSKDSAFFMSKSSVRPLAITTVM